MILEATGLTKAEVSSWNWRIGSRASRAGLDEAILLFDAAAMMRALAAAVAGTNWESWSRPVSGRTQTLRCGSARAERNTKSNLSKTYKISNIQFFLQANVWKGLFIGMNYQFFSVKNYKKDPNLGNLLSKKSATFFLVSASFGYVFEFLKNKNLQLQPSLRIGGYTADDYYDSGLGKKFYLGAECKIRYLIKGKA